MRNPLLLMALSRAALTAKITIYIADNGLGRSTTARARKDEVIKVNVGIAKTTCCCLRFSEG